MGLSQWHSCTVNKLVRANKKREEKNPFRTFGLLSYKIINLRFYVCVVDRGLHLWCFYTCTQCTPIQPIPTSIPPKRVCVCVCVCGEIGVWTRSCANKAGALPLEPRSSPSSSGYFGDGVWRNICSGWPWTSVFLISTFQIARIWSVSHQHWLNLCFLKVMRFLVICYRSSKKLTDWEAICKNLGHRWWRPCIGDRAERRGQIPVKLEIV
jgi:hypothetical protein